MKTKTKRLLTLLLCFVLLIASVAVVASAVGANVPASSVETDTQNGGKTTKYGAIPQGYEDKSVYPFVVYKYTNGTLKDTSALPTLATAIMVAKNYLGSNIDYWDAEKGIYTGNSIRSAVILMRDHYTTKSGKYNSAFVVDQPISETNAPKGDHYDNYAQMTGEVIIDLNGYTLTQGDGTSAIFSYVTNKGFDIGKDGENIVFESKYTVINGNVAVNTAPVVYANMWDSLYLSRKEVDGKIEYSSAAPYKKQNGEFVKVDGVEHSSESMADKDFVWNFDNVKFQYVSGATATNMLMAYGNYQSYASDEHYPPLAAAPFYFNYTNCAFDLTNAPAGATIFNAAPEQEKYLKASVNVTGGEIIATSAKLDSITFASVENVNGSSFNLKRDLWGEYVSLTLPNGESAPNEKITIGNAQYHWATITTISSSSKNSKTCLTECTASTNAHGLCNVCESVNGTCTDTDKNGVCDTCGAENIGGKWIEASNAELYPFAVLDASGNFYNLYTVWGRATENALTMDGATIIVRRDYALVPKYNGTAIDATDLRNRKGTLNVDLRGYSITRPANTDGEHAYLFDNYLQGSTTSDTINVIIKNGTLNAEWSLICLSGNADIKHPKTLNFTFEDVTFKFSKNTVLTGGWAIVGHADKYYRKTITSNLIFTDCTFDITEMTSNWDMTKTAAIDVDTPNFYGEDFLKVSVTFNGGKILANRLTAGGFMQLNSDDILTLNTGKDGKYLTLELPAGQVPGTPTEASMFTLSDGSRVYFHKSGDVYNLTECHELDGVHTCSCGIAMSVCYNDNNDAFCDRCGRVVGYIYEKYGITIDPKYASVDTYPFFVLKYQNGVYTFEGAFPTLYGKNGGSTSAAAYAAYNVINPNNVYNRDTKKYEPQGTATDIAEAIIVMRRDYSAKIGRTPNTNKGETYIEGAENWDNIAHAQGHVTIDLGGYTLSEAPGSVNGLFAATSKGYSDNPDGVYTFPASYTFKNGSLRVHTYALARLSVWDHIENTEKYDGWYVKDHPLNVTFDDVTFGYVEGATANVLALFARDGSISYGKSVCDINVNFNNCVFDLKTNVPNKNIDIIRTATQDKDCTNFQTKFTNCEILTSDISKISVYDMPTSANGTAVTLIKDANGSYMTLTMPAGSTPPAADKTVTHMNGITLVYNSPSYSDGYVHYQLSPDVLVDYKIKTSVTLHTNLIYNIYVPVDNVKAITLNGEDMQLEAVNVDGVECYSVGKLLSAPDSLNDFALKVTFNSGSGTVDAIYNLGIFEYSKALLDGDYIEISKTLAKDMLLYAYQAHKYFGGYGDSVAAKLIEIEDILSSHYRQTPSGIARNPQSGYFTHMELSVGANPAFRFYLVNPEAASDFAFTANGVAVERANVITNTNELGTYIEVRVPAYNMLYGIGITYQGTSIGSYNLYSYYNYVISDKPAVNSGEFAQYVKLIAIVEALMKYSESATAYTEYMGNGGFGSMILAVPEKIYPNVPGFDVTALFTNGAYYGNVTWTTSHSNVYVENGKIYAVGEFATDTPVTITAKTQHHTESVTVTVVSSTSQTYKYVENAYSGLSGDDINDTGITFVENQSDIVGEFAIKGKIDIYSVNLSKTDDGAPHIQFRFHDEQKFLFIDQDEDGIFNVIEYSFDSYPEKYNTNKGKITIDFAVVVVDKTAYLYIDGILEGTIDVSKAKYFILGALRMDVLFYDMEIYTKASNPAEYEKLSGEYTSGNMQDYGTLYIDAPSKIYPGAPAVDISAKVTLPTYTGAVTITTDNPNVIVENGKIYATGTFANDTIVTITASTAHHTATKTVLIPGTSSQTYKYVENLNSETNTSINDTGIYLKENGKNITGEFVVRGKFNVYAYSWSSGEPHLQLRFTKVDKTIIRFYMTPDANGIFKFKKSETGRTYNLDNGPITLDFAVVVVDKTAYLYIDGIREATLDVSKDEYFNLGALRMNVLFYDIELYTKANNEAKYNSAVAEYFK